MKISIGITTYNRVAFLRNCLQSIFRQGDFNIEVLIGNDFVSEKITASDLGFLNNKITIFNYPENLGELNNLNFLMRQATGDYFIWMADDDEFSPHSLNYLFKAIEEFPTFDFIIPRCHTGESFLSSIMDKNLSTVRLIDRNEFIRDYLRGELGLQGVYILFKRDFLTKLNGIKRLGEGPFYSDPLLVFKAIQNQKKIPFIDYPCTLFRVHDQSHSNSISDLKDFYNSQRAFFLEIKSMYKNDLFCDELIFNLYFYWFIRNFISVFFKTKKLYLSSYFNFLVEVYFTSRGNLSRKIRLIKELVLVTLKGLKYYFKSRLFSWFHIDKVNSRYKVYLQLEYCLIKFISLFVSKQNFDYCVVKMDGIGDYILFRNFLAEMKEHSTKKNPKILLIGNQAWGDLVNFLDQDQIDQFVEINRKKIWNDKFYRFKTLHRLSRFKADVLLSPTYSRELHFLDSLVRVVNAEVKITHSGNLTNMWPENKAFADSFFTKLVSTESCNEFEYTKSHQFFENVLQQSLSTLPHINIKFQNPFEGMSYIVLFIGGAAKFRRWSNKNYIELGRLLHNHFKCKIVYCGTVEDIDPEIKSSDFESTFEINFIGKSASIKDMLPVLSNACFVVSNETAIPHICVSLKKFVFVITNVYGRFTPYPENISKNHRAIFHEEIEASQFSDNELSLRYAAESNLKIDDISAAFAFNKILLTWSLYEKN